MIHPVDIKPCIWYIGNIGGVIYSMIVQNAIEHGLSDVYEPVLRLFPASKFMCYLIIVEIDIVILGKLLLDDYY